MAFGWTGCACLGLPSQGLGFEGLRGGAKPLTLALNPKPLPLNLKEKKANHVTKPELSSTSDLQGQAVKGLGAQNHPCMDPP